MGLLPAVCIGDPLMVLRAPVEGAMVNSATLFDVVLVTYRASGVNVTAAVPELNSCAPEKAPEERKRMRFTGVSVPRLVPDCAMW